VEVTTVLWQILNGLGLDVFAHKIYCISAVIVTWGQGRGREVGGGKREREAGTERREGGRGERERELERERTEFIFLHIAPVT
jgi:hypothetical protein